MSTKRTDIKLPTVDDLFSTQETREAEREKREDDLREKIKDIPLVELHPFKDHPFQVKNDDELRELARSIKQNGVVTPAFARLKPDGGYELIAGHRRKAASELAGLVTMPVVVRELDDDAATIVMVDSNQQRENLLPSEKAFSYKMKLEAIKRQGERADLTSGQLGPKYKYMRSNAELAAAQNESVKQIQRYIRLTNLIPEILKMVDEKQSLSILLLNFLTCRKKRRRSCMKS